MKRRVSFCADTFVHSIQKKSRYLANTTVHNYWCWTLLWPPKQTIFSPFLWNIVFSFLSIKMCSARFSPLIQRVNTMYTNVVQGGNAYVCGSIRFKRHLEAEDRLASRISVSVAAYGFAGVDLRHATTSTSWNEWYSIVVGVSSSFICLGTTDAEALIAMTCRVPSIIHINWSGYDLCLDPYVMQATASIDD